MTSDPLLAALASVRQTREALEAQVDDAKLALLRALAKQCDDSAKSTNRIDEEQDPGRNHERHDH